MEGFPDDSFRPDELLTRYEAARVLMHVSDRIRMENAATDPLIGDVMQSVASIQEIPSFTDIPPGHWAYESVTALESIGVIIGTPDSKFHGDDPITRDDLMRMIARLVRRWGLGYPADHSPPDGPQFCFDENEIYAVLEGTLTDYEFKYPSGLTRLESAVLFCRIWDGLMYFKGDQGYW